jgi:hypothetical protein
MAKFLYSIFSVLLNGFFRKIMIASGIGLFTGAVSKQILETLMNLVISNFSYSSDVLSLASIAGLDSFLSIIFGAILSRVTIDNLSLRLQKIPNE